MSISNKITSFFVLLASFLLILATGRTNVRNFKNIQNSIQEIYKDRLVVKGVIFELSTLLHKKELANISNSVGFYTTYNNSVNEKIKKSIAEFKATELTPDEERTLREFSNDIDTLIDIEKNFNFSGGQKINLSDLEKHTSIIKSLQLNLKTLSGIQIQEGKRKLDISSKAVKSMYQYDSFENYAMIILAILMVIVLFIPKPKVTINLEESNA